MNSVNGKCQCGNVSYKVEGDPFLKSVCHCLDCQAASGGGYTSTMVLLKESFTLCSGELSFWEKKCENGSITKCYFCSTCSNRIYHVNSENEGILRLKAGTLENSSGFIPQVHLWTKRRQPWIQIPKNVAVFESQPSNPEELFAAIEETTTS